jgi:predicted porin
MKKSLLALAALSAFATAAQAQSSVTVYGVIDVGYGSQETDQGGVAASNKFTGLADSTNASSRIGFRGTEDLGGGLSAGFVLESGLNITGGAQINKTNGTSVVAATSSAAPALSQTSADSAVFGAATRQAFVTVGSKNMGTLLVGYKKQLESDFNDTFMIGTENSYGAEGQELGRLGRANQIGYTLPTFNGVTASIAHSVATNDKVGDATDKIDVSITSANLMYNAGKLTVGAHIGSGSVEIGSDYNTATDAATVANFGVKSPFVTGSNDYDTQGVGVSYDFGVAKLAAMYGKREVGLRTDASFRETTYTNVGVAFPLGKTTLKASLSNNTSDDKDGVEKEKNEGYQLQADYSLSKRTTAWAVYGDNVKKVSGTADVDSTTFRVGVTHSF